MFRGFNEGQRNWRSDISQVSCLFLSVSFDVFLGLLVLLMGNAYLWLLIVYFVFLFHKYEIRKILLIAFVVLILFVVCNRPCEFNDSIQGEVKAVYYNGIQVDNYLIKTDTEGYELGDLIDANIVEIDNFKVPIDGAFDEYTYFKGKGIKYVTYPLKIQKIGHRFHLRNKAIEYLVSHSDERLKDIYLYLLLGDKNDGLDSLNEMATSMAIVHVFAISGMHFSMLMKMIVSFISHFMSEKKASSVALGFMFVYALCLEGNIAAWRAFFSLFFRKLGVKNEFDNYGLVGISFLILNPHIYLQTSFIYSMALYFLVILTKNIKYSSFFVYVGSMVISVYFQYELVPLGFLFGLLFNRIISSLFPLFVLDIITNSFISTLCFYVYQGMLTLMEMICKYSVTIIVGKPPAFLIISFFLLYVYAINQWDIYKIKNYFVYTIILFCFILVHPYLNPFGKVIMLDVGQGDCFIINFPYHKETVMIDTGGLSYQDVAAKRIIPALKRWGIKDIDTLYISHQDFDHCGAMESLNDHYSIKNIVTNFSQAQHQNISFIQLNEKIYNNENDNSLIIYTKLGGLNYLFTGDISSKVEEELIDKYPLMEVDVLKVSHHGSNTSSSNRFLQTIKPMISLISVGKNNRYGHPSRDVLNRLTAYGSIIKRTDEDGTWCIYFMDDKSYIEMVD